MSSTPEQAKVEAAAETEALVFEQPAAAGWYRIAIDAGAGHKTRGELGIRLGSAAGTAELLRLRLDESKQRQSVVLWVIPGDWRLQCVLDAHRKRRYRFSITRLPRWRALLERSWHVLGQLIKKGAARNETLGGLAAGWRYRGLRGLVDVVMAEPGSPHFQMAYRALMPPPDEPERQDIARLKAAGEVFARRPFFSLLMPAYNPDLELLEEAIVSIEQQTYRNWELCIADDASTDPAVRRWLEARAQRNPRIKVVYREHNGHISAASNSALALCQGEYVVLLDQDDLLPCYALHAVVDCLNAHPEARLIYSDEDKLDDEGNRYGAYHKPDWNPELILGQNMFSHLGVFERQLVLAAGGFREGYEGSQDYDLLLRCLRLAGHGAVRHIPHVLYHWRALPGSTARAMSAKSYAADSAQRALQDYLDACGYPGEMQPGPFPGGYRFQPSLPAAAPSLAILLPSPPRDWATWRRESELDAYPGQLSVLVAEVGPAQEASAAASDVRVVAIEASCGLAERFNRLAQAAESELILCLDPILRPQQRDWLGRLAALLYCDDVAAVGARIHDANKRLLHAGYVLGLFGSVGSPYETYPTESHGYFGQLALLRAASAVSAAGMLLRRKRFLALHGFDSVQYAQHGFDIDLCQRLAEQGYRVLVAPDIDLLDPVCDSRQRARQGWYWPGTNAPDSAAMQATTDDLQADPYYSPHLTLLHGALLRDPKPRIAMPWHTVQGGA